MGIVSAAILANRLPFRAEAVLRNRVKEIGELCVAPPDDRRGDEIRAPTIAVTAGDVQAIDVSRYRSERITAPSRGIPTPFAPALQSAGGRHSKQDKTEQERHGSAEGRQGPGFGMSCMSHAGPPSQPGANKALVGREFQRLAW